MHMLRKSPTYPCLRRRFVSNVEHSRFEPLSGIVTPHGAMKVNLQISNKVPFLFHKEPPLKTQQDTQEKNKALLKPPRCLCLEIIGGHSVVYQPMQKIGRVFFIRMTPPHQECPDSSQDMFGGIQQPYIRNKHV